MKSSDAASERPKGTWRRPFAALSAEARDRALFIMSLVLLAYAFGLASARFDLPPVGALDEIWEDALDWRRHWRSNLGIAPTRHMLNARADFEIDPEAKDRASPGLTLIESVFDDEVGLRLIDLDGEVVHTWPARFSELVPDAERASDRYVSDAGQARSDWEVHVNGSALYPDGDLVFSFGGLTMVRIDACGEPEWRLPLRGIHHALEVAGDGNIWTLATRYHDESSPEFPGMVPRFRDDLILEVSPDGEILREISILEVLYRNDMVGMLFPVGIAPVQDSMTDLLHANDVEILSEEDAPAFPLFEAGDAMISVRNLNLVMVLDPDTLEVKWFQTGPWLRQHDPDFHSDGRIVIFDNRDDSAAGRLLGGRSRLLAIDPVDRSVTTIFEGTSETPFFTNARGTVEILENGNFLAVETDAGRVVEVTPAGEIVWSYVNRYDERQVLAIQRAQRYPDSYGQFETSRCEGQ